MSETIDLLEIIDLVDKSNNIIGTTDVETAHKQNKLHRVIGVLLFDIKGNLYFQDGNTYNKYDLSVGGHVKQGESYKETAQREMYEELRIHTPLTYVSTFISPNAKLGHFWAIYQGIIPSSWKFVSTDEVSSVIKMSPQQLSEKLKSDPNLFTPGFINVFTEFIRIQHQKK